MTSSNAPQFISLHSELSVTLNVRNVKRLVTWHVEAFRFIVDRRNDFPDFETIVITVREALANTSSKTKTLSTVQSEPFFVL